ncbi:hypothetical protein [Winogradskyella forsetii]|uniref:hypothetical protein n=1 Tax=Winogradskyella forsetii TaxID=2686077 RepID=UPI0015BCEAC5|nr:hypothetical protein [Winogradskyella forsetii]
MKNTIFTLLFLGFYSILSAQSDPKVGDELIIKAPLTQSYHYIKFPKPNILIKRGTVTRYKSVYGNEVVVNEVITKPNGEVHVELMKKDGSKFFGFLSKVKANYTKAIEAEEMITAP